ncbi:alpha/beta fold hydrolase [Streptomyces mobaraensis]|uniref:Alpha/beta hydrolase n=1 Tax=Streptomyces mobaraensis TaxID=35621 RepID=A0A5N5VZ60_STRMB|nr:alpha/beta hydrolase [Streptomyces mobaraensis]KAB7833132.1 alpha/beta hydrolase [Streptomyces mobaraensis]
METGTLTVPGAEIHYEVRGAGPPLLLLNGGDGDAAMFGPLAGLMAEHHTVVTFDPRGNSRSRLTAPPREQTIEERGRDAHLLLDAVAPGQAAYVFGTSYGGMTGMDLLARHPDRVRALVAHDPFVVDLLPDADRWHALFRELHALHRREGPRPALRRLCEEIGLEDVPEPDEALPPPAREMLSRVEANGAVCLEYELRSFTRFRPDLEALRAGRCTLVTGEERPGALTHRTTATLAERLGTRVTEFPGGHVGYLTHPAEFAAALRGAFAD